MALFYVPRESRLKHEPRAKWGIHLGIADDCKAWIFAESASPRPRIVFATAASFFEHMTYRDNCSLQSTKVQMIGQLYDEAQMVAQASELAHRSSLLRAALEDEDDANFDNEPIFHVPVMDNEHGDDIVEEATGVRTRSRQQEPDLQPTNNNNDNAGGEPADLSQQREQDPSLAPEYGLPDLIPAMPEDEPDYDVPGTAVETIPRKSRSISDVLGPTYLPKKPLAKPVGPGDTPGRKGTKNLLSILGVSTSDTRKGSTDASLLEIPEQDENTDPAAPTPEQCLVFHYPYRIKTGPEGPSSSDELSRTQKESGPFEVLKEGGNIPTLKRSWSRIYNRSEGGRAK
jgi:hypothetical protein